MAMTCIVTNGCMRACVCGAVFHTHRFVDLLPLVSETDPETDLFHNASHLQQHRQVRALNRLGKLCTALAEAEKGGYDTRQDTPFKAAGGADGLISVRCIMDIALPIIQVRL